MPITAHIAGHRVMEVDSSSFRGLNSGGDLNFIVKVCVGTYSPGLMSCHIVSNTVSNVSNIAVILLAGILSKFRLIEINETIFTVPLHQVTESVLARDTKANDVVTINFYSGQYWIFTIFYLAVVVSVGPGDPNIVHDYIAGIDFHKFVCAQVFI